MSFRGVGVDRPTRDTMLLHHSVHKKTPNAVAAVLSELANKVDHLGSIDLQLGYLDPPLMADDNRRQVTIEFVAASDKKRVSTGSAEVSVRLDAQSSEVFRTLLRLTKGHQQGNVSRLLRLVAEELKGHRNIIVYDLFLSTYYDEAVEPYVQLVLYTSRPIARVA